MNNKVVQLDRVGHAYGPQPVLENISLDIHQGEIIALVGPSGCGKSTLLHILSGHLQPATGSVSERKTTRMVYQQNGLFPWLTIAENVALGLREVGDRALGGSRLQELLHLVRLDGFEKYYPHQISGGMRQRAEIARAMAGEPDLLLLDEPFSSLDYLTKMRLRGEMIPLLAARRVTAVLVTHDIEEAAQLADRILLLEGRPARIQHQWAVPIPHPRDLVNPELAGIVHRILVRFGFPAVLREQEKEGGQVCGGIYPDGPSEPLPGFRC
jgi:ABC-type nitrate/sulfonate/bicarbonate transport system ATPase subunit